MLVLSAGRSQLGCLNVVVPSHPSASQEIIQVKLILTEGHKLAFCLASLPHPWGMEIKIPERQWRLADCQSSSSVSGQERHRGPVRGTVGAALRVCV